MVTVTDVVCPVALVAATVNVCDHVPPGGASVVDSSPKNHQESQSINQSINGDRQGPVFVFTGDGIDGKKAVSRGNGVSNRLAVGLCQHLPYDRARRACRRRELITGLRERHRVPAKNDPAVAKAAKITTVTSAAGACDGDGD